jgi:hypothetical protein
VSILDIAPKVYDLMGVCNAVGYANPAGSLVPRSCSSGPIEGKLIILKFGKADK